MDIFNVLSLIGGLCLFLYGMNIMGQALSATGQVTLGLQFPSLWARISAPACRKADAYASAFFIAPGAELW